MRKINAVNFDGQTIFCGVDVHKKSWQVNIRCSEFELSHFNQKPSEACLYTHLQSRYPGATYQVVYEAGFSGYSLQRSLSGTGISCLVVNPADVPSSDKDKKRKSDRVDARKLSRELSNGTLTGIYIPGVEMEHARTLVRQRSMLVKDSIRCKSRIAHKIMFSGLALGEYDDQQYWSRRFVEHLRQLPCATQALRQALDLAIEEYVQVRKLLNQATRQIRILSQQVPYCKTQQLLQTIPGIGIVNAMIILTEVQDMARFSNLDKLCSYCGIVPDKFSSGEKEAVSGITHRSNNHLRVAIVESSWTIIRKDPAMLMLYKRYCQTMVPNKAIIKIAHHLLSRIRHVWRTGEPYQIGFVGGA
jgi:transposase